jgi:hypothetical protein
MQPIQVLEKFVFCHQREGKDKRKGNDVEE